MRLEKDYGADVGGAVQCETSFRVSVRCRARLSAFIHLPFHPTEHTSIPFTLSLSMRSVVVLLQGDFTLDSNQNIFVTRCYRLGVDIW